MSSQSPDHKIKGNFFPITHTLFQDMCRLKLSPSAQTVLLYIIRHTIGWQRENVRDRFVRLKIQDFIKGRPTADGDDRHDAGVSLSTPVAVMTALEECGVKGFIFELDRGKKDGVYSYGLQWKYWAEYDPAISEAQAQLVPTSKYRYKLESGKDYTVKDEEDQKPHYYGVPRKRKEPKTRAPLRKSKR